MTSEKRKFSFFPKRDREKTTNKQRRWKFCDETTAEYLRARNETSLKYKLDFFFIKLISLLSKLFHSHTFNSSWWQISLAKTKVQKVSKLKLKLKLKLLSKWLKWKFFSQHFASHFYRVRFMTLFLSFGVVTTHWRIRLS